MQVIFTPEIETELDDYQNHYPGIKQFISQVLMQDPAPHIKTIY